MTWRMFTILATQTSLEKELIAAETPILRSDGEITTHPELGGEEAPGFCTTK
jgi:hypothetical protein